MVMCSVENIRLNLKETVAPYKNPFYSNNYVNVYGFLPWRLNYIYKGLNASGTFSGKITEIMDINNPFTKKHHEHMKNIKKIWNVDPYIIYTDGHKKISFEMYNVDKIPNYTWLRGLDIYDSIKNIKKRSYMEVVDIWNNNYEKYNSLIIKETLLNKNKHAKYAMTNGNVYSIEDYFTTKFGILKKCDFIINPVAWNQKNKTFEKADLLIKASFMKEHFPDFIEILDSDDDEYFFFLVTDKNFKIINEVYAWEDPRLLEIKAKAWILNNCFDVVKNKNRCFIFDYDLRGIRTHAPIKIVEFSNTLTIENAIVNKSSDFISFGKEVENYSGDKLYIIVNNIDGDIYSFSGIKYSCNYCVVIGYCKNNVLQIYSKFLQNLNEKNKLSEYIQHILLEELKINALPVYFWPMNETEININIKTLNIINMRSWLYRNKIYFKDVNKYDLDKIVKSFYTNHKKEELKDILNESELMATAFEVYNGLCEASEINKVIKSNIFYCEFMHELHCVIDSYIKT